MFQAPSQNMSQVAQGNPAGLQSTQQPPQPKGGVPPDLLQALALQKVKKQQDDAARQLALSQGQPQPPVAQQLQSQLVGNEAQRLASTAPGIQQAGQQMAAQQQGIATGMAAGGSVPERGGIDSLAQHFDGGGEVGADDERVDNFGNPDIGMLARLDRLRSLLRQKLGVGDTEDAAIVNPASYSHEGRRGITAALPNAPAQADSPLRGQEQPVAESGFSDAGSTPPRAPAPAPARAQPGSSSASISSKGPSGIVAGLPQSDFEKLLEAKIRSEMARDPNAEYETTRAKVLRDSGLADYTARRTKNYEDIEAKHQAEVDARDPEWLTRMRSMLGQRDGLSAAASGVLGVHDAAKANAAADSAYARSKADYDNATGADEYKGKSDAVKEALAQQGVTQRAVDAALQSGVWLETKREAVMGRLQAAKDAAAARHANVQDMEERRKYQNLQGLLSMAENTYKTQSAALKAKPTYGVDPNADAQVEAALLARLEQATAPAYNQVGIKQALPVGGPAVAAPSKFKVLGPEK